MLFSARKIFTIPELRKSILFVLFVLVIFRLAAHIPLPGVDVSALAGLIETNQFLGLLNIFSGGTLDNFSVVALGLGPYITSSIIFQLFAMVIPQLEAMQKEEAGRQKINQWTRIATIPLSILQGYGLVALIKQQGGTTISVVGLTGWDLAAALVVMTTGTIFLMWIGELISEKKVGNGISLMIFAGIIAGLPTFVQQLLTTFDKSQLLTLILLAIGLVVVVASVVIMNEAVRNIPIQYARAGGGGRLAQAVASTLPLKVNTGGMIPVIFAISAIIFPSFIAQFLVHAESAWVRGAASWVLQTMQNQLFYGVIFFTMVFVFTFFYASVIFHPQNTAENLQKQGAFIPGIRPGVPTAQYLTFVLNRILLGGALFLSIIAVLPIVIQQFTGTSQLVIGGTSVIIVVSVVIDAIKQIEGQIAMREYDY